MDRRLSNGLSAALALTLVLSAGCGRSNRDVSTEPLPPPVSTQATTHFAGSPLSGPMAAAVAAPPPAEAIAVRVELISLENVPSVGTPLGSEARLILAQRLGAPVLPSGRLTGSARLISIESREQFQAQVVTASKGRSVSYYRSRAALPAGVTAAFDTVAKDALDVSLAGTALNARLQIYVGRPATVVPADMPQPVQIAVAIEDLADLPIRGDLTQDGSAGPTSRMAQREIALIEREVAEPLTLAITVPMSFGGAGQAIAALIEITPGDTSTEHLQALSTAMQQVRESGTAVASRPTTLPTGRDASAELRAASESLARTDRLRQTLVYLGGQTGARLTEDTALVADDSILQKLAEQARAALDAASAAGVGRSDPKAVGWLLDKATLQQLGKYLNEGKLPPELSAVLSTHAGEAGRNVGSIEDVSRHMTSREDLDNRLVAENLIYLEDASPSARVRAFDWLNSRGRAPANFDPLASAKDRRLALEQGLAAAAAGPTTAPTRP